MISAGHSLAAAAGYRILEDGGNAIDAGVASGIVINTVLPENTSFGGVAPIMIYDAASGEVVTISGLGRWPRKASAEFFIEQAGGEIPVGILRSIVPAAPDAWLTALERYGTMSFEQVVTPTLELAEEGIPFPATVHRALQRDLDSDDSVVRRWPSTSAVFLPEGRLPEVGERFRQPDLGRTFSRMVEAERSASAGGREAAVRAARDLFYRGEIAEEMAAFSEQEGGLITFEDLAEFSVKIEPPVSARFKDYEIVTCDAWCQGPVVAQVLQMLEHDDLPSLGHNSADYIHLLSQSLNLAFADRHEFYGDPDVIDVPIAELLSPQYTRARRDAVDMLKAFTEMPPAGDPSNSLAAVEGSSRVVPAGTTEEFDTSYTCVIDRWGNGFSATPSDALFHSPIVPGLGLIMSGRGSQSWLEAGQPSRVEPWKRPRLTPNPSMAFRDGKLFMPFGCPGGDAQPQAMVQLFLNIAEFGMNVQQAIEAPRFTSSNFPNSFWPHTYLPGRLNLEGRIDAEVGRDLAGRGHDIVGRSDWEGMSVGALSAIVVDAESGVLTAGADPRRDAYAIGR
ncbi:MAG TPA: gamma-glutamyltransferase family protein [Dehalococcoidia bacterium]|nr:gamma-glutamyltransferase family protein [Dehalococcoidia bacterium]